MVTMIAVCREHGHEDVVLASSYWARPSRGRMTRPSLQLDITADLPEAQKRLLARRMSEEYSQIMGSDPRLMTVVIRTLPPGSVWHCTTEDPVPGTLLMCDVRAGRDRATRERLARRLIDLVAEHGAVDPAHIKVEFTQHSGDEMFHPFLGGFNRDWDLEEQPPPTDGT